MSVAAHTPNVIRELATEAARQLAGPALRAYWPAKRVAELYTRLHVAQIAAEMASYGKAPTSQCVDLSELVANPPVAQPTNAVKARWVYSETRWGIVNTTDRHGVKWCPPSVRDDLTAMLFVLAEHGCGLGGERWS